MEKEAHPRLVRAIGRWSLTALVVNSIIGSGIFGLPSAVAALVGASSPYAVILSGLGMGIIMACFAEVASQFKDAGGPYLYARATFGRFVGLQMGWFAWLVRLTAAGANANLFVDYLAEFLPAASAFWPRLAVLTAIIWGLAAINYRGVKQGASTSNIFVIAKLIPLLIFIICGLALLGGKAAPHMTSSAAADWSRALLLLAFAYGGFEAALIPVGEVKNPRRDAPFALFSALAIVTLVYTLIQIVVITAIPAPEATKRPLADAARVFLGSAGAAMISLGALISVYGYLSSAMLNTPRLTFAFAERADFPRIFGAVHSRFRTPYVSIVVFAGLLWILAAAGSFRWNAMLSAIARLFTYGLVCGALIKLRKKHPQADAFRLPLGTIFAFLGILFSLYLMSNIGMGELVALALTTSIAFIHWLQVRKSGGLPK